MRVFVFERGVYPSHIKPQTELLVRNSVMHLVFELQPPSACCLMLIKLPKRAIEEQSTRARKLMCAIQQISGLRIMEKSPQREVNTWKSDPVTGQGQIAHTGFSCALWKFEKIKANTIFQKCTKDQTLKISLKNWHFLEKERSSNSLPVQPAQDNWVSKWKVQELTETFLAETFLRKNSTKNCKYLP